MHPQGASRWKGGRSCRQAEPWHGGKACWCRQNGCMSMAAFGSGGGSATCTARAPNPERKPYILLPDPASAHRPQSALRGPSLQEPADQRRRARPPSPPVLPARASPGSLAQLI